MGAECWRASSDVAQVVAQYLRCHPRVEALRYPGIKSDPNFEEASHMLVGGFGPIVAYRVGGRWHELTCEPGDPRTVVMELERQLAADERQGVCP